MTGPEQEPDNSQHSKEDFADFESFHRPGDTPEFHYSDSTPEHILNGESQKFHYGRTPLPDKG